MTQYVECPRCYGEREWDMWNRPVRCDHCDGVGHVPMPEIPHIQRIEETEE